MKKIILALSVLLAFPAATNAQECYTVNSGDSFWQVAQKFNVSLFELKEANPSLDNFSWITVGQEINLPEDHLDEKASDNQEEAEETPAEQDQSQNTNEDSSTPADKNGGDESAEQQEQTEAPEASNQESVNEEDADTSKETLTESQFEQEVIRLTNIEREQRGLAPLKAYSELSDVARDKSEDMRDKGYFSHNSPTYGSPFDMMDSYGIEYRGAGENIAAGQKTPEQVVEGWMNSQGHRENILNESFTHIGVGHAEGGSYGHYWTQMFVTK